MTNWVLRGGTVIDGTGAPRFRADVTIAGDRIAGVGQVARSAGTREIDVSGKIVAPGFIDVHTHDDRALFASPEMQAKASQGVTTVITGNCGLSLAPLSLDRPPPPPLDLIGDAGDYAYPRFADYLAAIDRAPRRSMPPASSATRRCASASCPTSTGQPKLTRSRRWASGCRKRLMPARSACRRGSTMPRRLTHRRPRSRRWRRGCSGLSSL
jgi:hypothetical protein